MVKTGELSISRQQDISVKPIIKPRFTHALVVSYAIYLWSQNDSLNEGALNNDH